MDGQGTKLLGMIDVIYSAKNRIHAGARLVWFDMFDEIAKVKNCQEPGLVPQVYSPSERSSRGHNATQA